VWGGGGGGGGDRKKQLAHYEFILCTLCKNVSKLQVQGQFNVRFRAILNLPKVSYP